MNTQHLLNQQIANWSLLNTKLHRFHWYVKGPHFFTLHEKFEAFYNEAGTIIDDLAERLLSIGGQPIATMKEHLEQATLSETNHEQTAEDMVRTLVDDYSLIIEEAKQLIEVAGNEDDEATADFFVGMVKDLQQRTWMLNAFLGA
ncbi:Dps family protein [Priestia koreensis]|uniref:Dps family protein n=1 Tax=Priestia koreensis TaxID=284581 RepID=UPI00204599C3|nr:Dps family protein [Priestia koreensis]UNL82947.1 DNA starvation/stationary phase protection protein [Priestia koreensis]